MAAMAEAPYPVSLEPDAPLEVARWRPLVHWLLAVPHYIVLLFLLVGAAVASIIGFFAVLVTGQWPEGLRQFIVGVHRWAYRVQAYVFLLTDVYPPFRLD